MKTCPNCNAQLDDNAVFCTNCGTKISNSPQDANSTTAQQGVRQQFQPIAPADNRKTYSIMSYIGILWLFGLCAAPEKYDQRVRFNVGQGIIVSILNGACTVIAVILTTVISAIFKTEETTILGIGTGSYVVSPIGEVLNTLIWLATFGISIFYLVYGIVKVSKDQDAYLPIIGKLAFYK